MAGAVTTDPLPGSNGLDDQIRLEVRRRAIEPVIPIAIAESQSNGRPHKLGL